MDRWGIIFLKNLGMNQIRRNTLLKWDGWDKIMQVLHQILLEYIFSEKEID